MLGLGVVFDHYALEKFRSHPTESSDSKKLHHAVSAEEIRQYLRIQNAEEKLKKADELLSKMIQIYVADLGLHLSPQEINQLQKPFTKNFSIANPKASPPSSEPQINLPAADEMKPKNLNPQMRQFRVEILGAKDSTEAEQLIESLSSEKISSRVQSSGELQPDQVKALNGHFKGQIVLLESASSHNDGPYSVDLDFQGEFRRSEVLGSGTLILKDAHGKQFSKGGYKGNLGKNFSSSNESILIEIGGSYLELIYFPQMDQFFGNYYNVSKGLYQLVGRVHLQRN